MSNPVPPGWPTPGALPFSMFGAPVPGPAPGVTGPASAGFAGGVDFVRKFWEQMPGASAMPGFLVPTVDVEELDKRIADLRAAERWLDVNLNMLRATVQGLEVQRHTIAAVQSWSAMRDQSMSGASAGAASGWPGAAAVPVGDAPAAPPAWMTPQPADRGPDATTTSASAADGPSDATAPPEMQAMGAAMAGLSANSWLGFLQEQFARVAEAAVATSPTAPPAESNAPEAPSSRSPAAEDTATAKKATRKSARR